MYVDELFTWHTNDGTPRLELHLPDEVTDALLALTAALGQVATIDADQLPGELFGLLHPAVADDPFAELEAGESPLAKTLADDLAAVRATLAADGPVVLDDADLDVWMAAAGRGRTLLASLAGTPKPLAAAAELLYVLVTAALVRRDELVTGRR